LTSPTAVSVFGSSQTVPGSPEWIEALEVGSRLASQNVAVVTGGYGGTMEAVSKGAAEAGGHVVGVTAPELFTTRASANPYVIETIEATTLTGRIGVMMDRSEGAIALAGSIGTAAELLILWNTNHILRRTGATPLPCAAVGDGWKDVATSLVENIGAGTGDVHHVDTGDEAVSWILGQIEIL